MPRPPSFVMERYGPLRDMDRSFDIAYWQRLGPAAIFEAAWQMVVDAHSRPPVAPHRQRLPSKQEQGRPVPSNSPNSDN